MNKDEQIIYLQNEIVKRGKTIKKQREIIKKHNREANNMLSAIDGKDKTIKNLKTDLTNCQEIRNNQYMDLNSEQRKTTDLMLEVEDLKDGIIGLVKKLK